MTSYKSCKKQTSVSEIQFRASTSFQFPDSLMPVSFERAENAEMQNSWYFFSLVIRNLCWIAHYDRFMPFCLRLYIIK